MPSRPPRRPLPNPGDLKDPEKLWQIIRDLYETQLSFQQAVEDLRKTSLQQGRVTRQVQTNTVREIIERAVLVGGVASSAPAQRALIPVVDTLPPVATATVGEAVQLSTTGVIYVFQQGNPGSWVAATATAAAHQASHQSGGSDALTGNLDAVARNGLRINSGGSTYERRRHNIIAGSGISLSLADDAGNEEVDLTVVLGALLGTNGAQYEFIVQTEEITLSTVATTTDSTANLLRGTGIVLAVGHYITQTISGGGVTVHSLGDPTTAGRFRNADPNLLVGTGFANYRHLELATLAIAQAANAKARITCDAVPTQGRVRVSTLCLVMTAPTS